MSEQNRPPSTSEAANTNGDRVQAAISEAAGATAVNGAGQGGFAGEELRAASERSSTDLKQAVAAAGTVGHPTTVEGGSGAFVDPAPKGAAPDEEGMVLRCRGFTGEGEEEEKKGGLGVGPCIVTTEDAPETGEGSEEEHTIRDPGIHEQPHEEENPHEGGGCIRYTPEDEPKVLPADVPPEADGTVVAIDAIMRTF